MANSVSLKNSGTRLELGPEIGRAGGQGVVRSVKQNPNLGIKVYKSLPNQDEIVRLETLISKPIIPSRSGYTFALPLDTAIDIKSGDVAGFAMQLFKKAADIKSVFQASFWLCESFLIRVAKHCSHALSDLHQAKLFRRDFENTLVLKDGSIVVIDCDSLQGTDTSFSLAKPDYLPPELISPCLQGELGQIGSSKEQDLWGHACEMWKLLRQEGDVHPFACDFVGGAAKRPKRLKRVEDALFPWDKNQSEVRPPKASKSLDTLEPRIVDLFLETFVDGHSDPIRRAETTQWIRALSRLDNPGSVELGDAQWKCVLDGTKPKVQKSKKANTNKGRGTGNKGGLAQKPAISAIAKQTVAAGFGFAAATALLLPLGLWTPTSPTTSSRQNQGDSKQGAKVRYDSSPSRNNSRAETYNHVKPSARNRNHSGFLERLSKVPTANPGERPVFIQSLIGPKKGDQDDDF